MCNILLVLFYSTMSSGMSHSARSLTNEMTGSEICFFSHLRCIVSYYGSYGQGKVGEFYIPKSGKT